MVHVDGYAGFERLTAGGKSCSLPAGRIRGASSMMWNRPPDRPSPLKHCAGSPIFMRSKPKPEDKLPNSACTGDSPLRAPVIDASKAWLESQLTQIPQNSGLADAIRYALRRWKGLTRFLGDGHIELDTNTVEREIRPVTLGRKNHLFAGSDGAAGTAGP